MLDSASFFPVEHGEKRLVGLRIMPGCRLDIMVTVRV